MTIILKIEPETEQALAQVASGVGLGVEEYLLAMIQNVTRPGLLKKSHSLHELRGLGEGTWKRALGGQDAQDYVNAMRDEWERK